MIKATTMAKYSNLFIHFAFWNFILLLCLQVSVADDSKESEGLYFNSKPYNAKRKEKDPQISIADHSKESEGIYFNSNPYNTKSKEKEQQEWKSSGDSNPWVVNNPPAPPAQVVDFSYNSNSHINRNNARNENRKLPPAESDKNQRRNENVHNLPQRNQMQTGHMISLPASGSEENVKDIYLKSVNSNSRKQSSNLQSHNSGRKLNLQQEGFHKQEKQSQNVHADNKETVQISRISEIEKEERSNVPQNKYSPNNLETENIHVNQMGIQRNNENRYPGASNQGSSQRQELGSHNSRDQQFQFGNGKENQYANDPRQKNTRLITTSTTTTTTTTASIAKDGEDNLFFNSWQYNSEKRQDTDKKEEDWKSNNEMNPFLSDNQNEPRKEEIAVVNYIGQPEPMRPVNEHVNEQRPIGHQNQRPQEYHQQKSHQSSVQEAPEVLKTKWQYEEEEEMKQRNLENFQNSEAESSPRRSDLRRQRPKTQPVNRNNNAAYSRQSYEVSRREEMEKSGELDVVPKSFYDGKIKFTEPERGPIAEKRHFKDSLQDVVIEEDPPTTIQRVKNWFFKGKSAATSLNVTTIRNSFLFLCVTRIICLMIV